MYILHVTIKDQEKSTDEENTESCSRFNQLQQQDFHTICQHTFPRLPHYLSKHTFGELQNSDNSLKPKFIEDEGHQVVNGFGGKT